MKKIALLFYLVCLALSAQELSSFTQEVININRQAPSPDQNAKKQQIITQIAQNIAKKNISTSEDSLQQAINNLKSKLQGKKPQTPYELADDKIKLNLLLANESFNQAIANLAKNDHSQAEIQKMLSDAIETLKQFKPIKIDQSLQNQLQPQQEHLNIALSTYIEILQSLQSHPEMFPRNNLFSGLDLGGFDLSWLLGHLQSILPAQFNHLGFAKAILSLGIFAIFFLLRRSITHLLVYCFSTLSVFFENKAIQDQIKEQIAAPILWLILLLSCKLSLLILLFPQPISPKLEVWIDACFVVSFSWLAILLFKGYGTAILGNLAQKNNVFRREIVNLLLKVIYSLIIVITSLSLLANFGFNISALIASLGIGGVAVAFAIKDILANFFGSVVLLFDHSFNQGDWIVCGEIEGTVIEIGLRRTMIRTFDNAVLFVPNSLLANGVVKNWNRRTSGRRIKFNISLTYRSNPSQIRACVRDIQMMLLQHPDIAKEGNDQKPIDDLYELDLKSNILSLDDLLGYKRNLFVVLEEFADSSINLLVYCFSKTTTWGEWLEIRQDVMLKIMDILKKHNLSFAFPTQSLYIEKIPPLSEKTQSPKIASSIPHDNQ